MRGRQPATLFLLALATSGLVFAQMPPQAMELYHAGKFQQSADILAKIAPASSSAEVHLWLGKCWLKLRKTDDAVRELENASGLSPSDSMIRLWLGRAYGRKASVVPFFFAPGWARKVVQQFEAAVKLSPRNMDARFDLLEYYLQAPGFLGGGNDRAEAETKQIASLDPHLGFTARARVLEGEKKYDPAMQELVRATVEFPEHAGAFVDLAAFQLDRKNYGEARANARSALAIDSGNVKAKLLACAASISLGEEIADCEKTLRQITSGPLHDDSDPGFEDAYYWLGRALQAAGKNAEAGQAYRTALAFDPDYQAAKSALDQVRGFL
jgi:tetratricopeptide (TPR) repeat protein